MDARNRRAGRLRIVVGGFLGLLPAGGVTWDYLQYPLGFCELGHDTFYIEDTRLWPAFGFGAEYANCKANVEHLGSVMNAFDLGDRWAYRDEVSGEWYGMSRQAVRDVCRTADVFVNVSCSTCMREEYQEIPIRALIDSDPMFTQIQLETQVMFTQGTPSLRELTAAHTHHFTFGENIGSPDCLVPLCGIEWIPTRQPICLGHWPVSDLPTNANAGYTTVMNWSAAEPLEYGGQTWGQKNVELTRLMQLPKAIPGLSLGLAVGETAAEPFPRALATGAGWRVWEAKRCVGDWRSYQRFIRESRGEFSVAKETYVKARTGWFSCRSACYLASGRPVITQETGWSSYLPSGVGLLAFEDQEGAVEALHRVEADPQRHARAARTIAEAAFDSCVVLRRLLDSLGA